MIQVLRAKFLLTALILFSFQYTNAQKKGKAIEASLGLGVSAPYDDVDIIGTGFYAQGEYVFGLTRWFAVRPYAGLILTSADKSPEQQDLAGYKVTTNAFLIGGKVRLTAPIPWVAPYLEVGVGASMGSFMTFTPLTDLQDNGLLVHIPYSIGLALGRKHNLELEFTFYEHPSIDQYAGAFAVGFSFPVN